MHSKGIYRTSLICQSEVVLEILGAYLNLRLVALSSTELFWLLTRRSFDIIRHKQGIKVLD
jgi:hypothetical protein